VPCTAVDLPKFELISEDYVGSEVALDDVNATATVCTNVPGRRLLSQLLGSGATSETSVAYVFSGGVAAGNYKARGAQVLLAATSDELLELLQGAFLSGGAGSVAPAATMMHTVAEFFVAEPLPGAVEQDTSALVPSQQSTG
jgi:hypothetical protein